MPGSLPPAVPDRLRAQVLAEWAPVVPLRSPGRRALVVAPLAVLMTAIAAVYWGPQPDWRAPGFGLTLALSTVQWIAGLGLLALALRDAVPGRAPGRGALVAAFAGVMLLLAVSLAAKDAVAPAVVPHSWSWRFWAICLRGALMLALPVVAVGSVFALRAFPTRPGRAGALAGLAAGVFIDAGWRLGCFVTEPSHVAGAHWLAIGASTGLGAGIVWVADVLRWRR